MLSPGYIECNAVPNMERNESAGRVMTLLTAIMAPFRPLPTEERLSRSAIRLYLHQQQAMAAEAIFRPTGRAEESSINSTGTGHNSLREKLYNSYLRTEIPVKTSTLTSNYASILPGHSLCLYPFL